MSEADGCELSDSLPRLPMLPRMRLTLLLLPALLHISPRFLHAHATEATSLSFAALLTAPIAASTQACCSCEMNG